MYADMIINIIPSVYCVPGIVLSALPTLLHLILTTVEYKLQGGKTIANCFCFKRGGENLLSIYWLNPQNSE